jgi:hypothetical protein
MKKTKKIRIFPRGCVAGIFEIKKKKSGKKKCLKP